MPQPQATDVNLLDVEFYLDLALAHGEDSEPDHEVGDLQDYLRAAWALMTPEQRRQFALSPVVHSTMEASTPDMDDIDEAIDKLRKSGG